VGLVVLEELIVDDDRWDGQHRRKIIRPKR
jgi:hypothetical protein